MRVVEELEFFKRQVYQRPQAAISIPTPVPGPLGAGRDAWPEPAGQATRRAPVQVSICTVSKFAQSVV